VIKYNYRIAQHIVPLETRLRLSSTQILCKEGTIKGSIVRDFA